MPTGVELITCNICKSNGTIKDRSFSYEAEGYEYGFIKED